MSKKLLLTSFQTWLPHQISNTSDDLLKLTQEHKSYLNSLLYLRNLPVDTKLAKNKVIKTIKDVQPQVIVCCGMAESRKKLTVESNATCRENRIFTRVNLEQLIPLLVDTTVSHDAGKFVCEGLYYEVLQYCQNKAPNTTSLFVHVPLLNAENKEIIRRDFTVIIQFLTAPK